MKYPLGLESYPHPLSRAQTQTRIRAQRVGYPRVREYFVPIAIFTLHAELPELPEVTTPTAPPLPHRFFHHHLLLSCCPVFL